MSNNIISKNAKHLSSAYNGVVKSYDRCLKVKIDDEGVAYKNYQKTIDEMNIVVERLKGVENFIADLGSKNKFEIDSYNGINSKDLKDEDQIKESRDFINPENTANTQNSSNSANTPNTPNSTSLPNPSNAPDLCDFLWLLQYEDVYTVGKMGQAENNGNNESNENNASLGLQKNNASAAKNTNAPANVGFSANVNAIKTIKTERGGRETYHCVGQRIAYFMCNLRRKYGDKADVRKYVNNLEQVIINTIGDFGIKGFRIDGKIGIWVNVEEFALGDTGVFGGDCVKGDMKDYMNGDMKGDIKKSDAYAVGVAGGANVSGSGVVGCKFAKIAAIGIKVSRWVCSHGCAINVNADLSGFEKITPCGIEGDEFGVCSLKSLGVNVSIAEFDEKFVANFLKIFDYSYTIK